MGLETRGLDKRTSERPDKLLPLDGLHRRHGAVMRSFAGFAMPLQYGSGLVAECRSVRTGVGIFDVSHMGWVSLYGGAAFLSEHCPVEIERLAPNRMAYTQVLNPGGGIIDDCLVGWDGQRGCVDAVFNAANVERVLAHLGGVAPGGVRIQTHEGAMVAVQGPEAAQALAPHIEDLESLGFLDFADRCVGEADVRVARAGYTGEDGFELAGDKDALEGLVEALVENGARLCGLGARDALRLEAGLCLHGQDISEEVTPVEAGLTFSIPRHRRHGEGYAGAEVVRAQLDQGVPRSLLGFRLEGKIAARSGCEVQDAGGRLVGGVTSGSFSPTLGYPVGMALLSEALEVGDRLGCVVRGKVLEGVVTALPFVAHRYHRAKRKG